MANSVHKSIASIKNQITERPDFGIILGTGLDGLVDEIQINKTIPYNKIEGFPESTVEFHKGQFIFGTLEGKRIIAMQGRFHFYEGYSAAELVLPVRVMHGLGIKRLIVSNAAGNLRRNWQKGELMLIQDHINLLPDNPLRGKEAKEFGPIFLDMSQPYDSDMCDSLIAIAKKVNITLNQGVYAAVAGPNLETKAEYRYLQIIGADAVGMSTIPEVIAARQLSLPVAAISVLTDDCDPENLQPVDIDEILEVARTAEKDLIQLIKVYISMA